MNEILMDTHYTLQHTTLSNIVQYMSTINASSQRAPGITHEWRWRALTRYNTPPCAVSYDTF